MKPFDFSLFSDRQLEMLAHQVTQELVTRRAKAREFIRRRGGLIEGAGPKYRNPENSAETWSGRGPRPEWFEAALADGWRLENLEIQGDRPTEP
jgi:DNA-binding protein H-NS